MVRAQVLDAAVAPRREGRILGSEQQTGLALIDRDAARAHEQVDAAHL